MNFRNGQKGHHNRHKGFSGKYSWREQRRKSPGLHRG